MGEIFHIAEVLDLGIEKEKKRRDFYALVAEKFQEKDMKDLFTQLRDWEEMHIKKFSQLRARFTEPSTTEAFSGQLQEYMDVLVNEKLYGEISPAMFTTKVNSALIAIDYSMGFEKDAILFFSGLLPVVPSYNKDIVEELIDEEKKHLVFLSALRKKYAK